MSQDTNVHSTSSDPQTVTSLTAQTLNPGAAAAKILKSKGVLANYWNLACYLLEALGVKWLRNNKIDRDYDDINLDEIVERGRFPYRPSDLFLKVAPYEAR
jgi:hypothetical protein